MRQCDRRNQNAFALRPASAGFLFGRSRRARRVCAVQHIAQSRVARVAHALVFCRSPQNDPKGLVPIEVTLAIQLPDLSDRLHAGQVVDRLAQLGGKLIGWTPENRDTSARATNRAQRAVRAAQRDRQRDARGQNRRAEHQQVQVQSPPSAHGTRSRRTARVCWPRCRARSRDWSRTG